MHHNKQPHATPLETVTQPEMAEIAQPIAHSEHVFTVPNAMTAFRAAMAVVVPILMIKGGNLASVPTALAAASDKESSVADFIDKRYPGWGRSELGKRADPIADTIFGAGMTVGAVFSPKTPATAKAAAVLSGAKVTKQSAWAIKADRAHREATGEAYVADVDMTGKIGTAAMLASAGLGTIAGDLNPNKRRQAKARNIAGIGSLAFAGIGLYFGEKARRQHDTVLKAKLAHYKTAQ